MMGAVFSLHLFNWLPVTDCTTARLQMVPVTINITIELDCFVNVLVGDGGASLQVCDSTGEADDFDLGAVGPIFLQCQLLEHGLLNLRNRVIMHQYFIWCSAITHFTPVPLILSFSCFLN